MTQPPTLSLTSVLLAVDASPFAASATRYAALFSGRLGLPLQALTILDSRIASMSGTVDAGLGDTTLIVPEFDSNVQKVLEGNAEEIKGTTEAALHHLGAETVLEVRAGLPAEEIVAAAGAETLLVLGKQGEGAELGSSPQLGSVAERVVRRAEGAVLLVPETFEEPRRLLLGYDGSDGAKEALEVALNLSRRLELPLLALSVHDNESQAQAQLAEVRDRAARDELPLETLALSGDPVEALRGAAQPGDVIAIGAFGAGRLAEFFRGSTTEHIVRGVGVPVLLHS